MVRQFRQDIGHRSTMVRGHPRILMAEGRRHPSWAGLLRRIGLPSSGPRLDGWMRGARPSICRQERDLPLRVGRHPTCHRSRGHLGRSTRVRPSKEVGRRSRRLPATGLVARGKAKGHHLVLRQELRSQMALPQTAPREKGTGGVDIGTGVAKKVTVRVENVEEQKEQRPKRRKGRRWTLRQETFRHLQTHRRATCRHRPLLTELSQRESGIDGDIRTRIRTGPKAARTVSGSTVAEEGEEKGTTPEASCEESSVGSRHRLQQSPLDRKSVV